MSDQDRSRATNLQPPPELPEEIRIETPYRAIAAEYYYAVFNGRLWRKKRPPAGAQGDEPWELWGSEGLPWNIKDSKSFPEVKAVMFVYADGDAAIAVTPNRRIYVYQTRGSLVAPDFLYNWYPTWGAPFPDKIFLPQPIRGAAFSRRSYSAGLYLEDPLGNHVNAGGPAALVANREGETGSLGLIHIFTISADGTELHYSDTGLPSGFGYQFGMPLRGRFIARGIAASCSIVFLIGETGRMYTALRDFDVCGNNPMMFSYSYKRIRQVLKPGQQMTPNFMEIVNLPMEDWRRQPDIPLQGRAAITHNLTMLTTGFGNAARELRVQGTDSQARGGYYYKKIFEEQWHFKITGEKFPEEDLINTTGKMMLGPKKDFYMEGELNIGGTRMPATILNFNLTCSPASIEIILPGQGRLKLLLHTVDGWTMLPLHNPGRDGIPKLFWGTLELTPGDFDSPQSDIKALANQMATYQLEVFAFHVLASTAYIKVKSLPDFTPRLRLIFKTSSTLIPEIRYFNDYLAILDNEDNTIRGINLLQAGETAKLKKVIKENRTLLKQLQTIQKTVLKQAIVQSVGSQTIYLGESFIGLLSKMKLEITESWAGLFVKRLFKWGPPLIYKRCRILWSAYRDLKAAVRIIRLRIWDYGQHRTYATRKLLFDYLAGAINASPLALSCPALKGCRGLYTDMAGFLRGEESFSLSTGNLKMQACFTRLPGEVKAAAGIDRTTTACSHLLKLSPLVEPEDLPDSDRLLYNRLFKKQPTVTARLLVYGPKLAANPQQGIFLLKPGEWSGQ